MKRYLLSAAVAALMLCAQPSMAAPPAVADYERAIGLRDAWQGLTRDVAEPAQWLSGTHRFIYRKSVEGGFQFMLMDADTGEKTVAFDHDRLAKAFNAAAGTDFTGLTLPFTQPFSMTNFSDGGRKVAIRWDEAMWN
ncbi:MAG: S9 family peptidase, partial [Asticcacaulis sp.]